MGIETHPEPAHTVTIGGARFEVDAPQDAEVTGDTTEPGEHDGGRPYCGDGCTAPRGGWDQ